MFETWPEAIRPRRTAFASLSEYRLLLASAVLPRRSRAGSPINLSHCAHPERWVTFHTGDMDYTIGLLRESKMPWRECNPMDERLKFIARLLDGEKMAGLCREFGIPRKTGYNILHPLQRDRPGWAE